MRTHRSVRSHSMPTSSNDSLLAKSPEEGARLLALQHLKAARTAARQLGRRTSESSALHDFRVALRRLGTVLRIYRAPLRATVSRKQRRALKSLRRSTGVSRDLEVLSTLLRALTPGRRARALGPAWLQEVLSTEARNERTRLREQLEESFPSLATQLEEGFGAVRFERQVGKPSPSFASDSAHALAQHRAQLVDRLTHLRRATAVEDLHEARIAAKRLRYLVEGLVPALAEAQPLVSRLKTLQDELGALHDLQVLLGVLCTVTRHPPKAARALAAPPPQKLRLPQTVNAPIEAELHQLATKAAEWVESRFRRLRTRHLGRNILALRSQVDALGSALRKACETEPLPVEIERKFLLRSLPAHVRRMKPWLIEQGWIPGEVLHERLRKLRHPNGKVTCYRTVKLGRGLRRVEVEEETPIELFEKLWPLTEGKRVCKKRYRVKEGERTWELDAFTDRTLFLAEVELPSEDARIVLPPWLRKSVVREVTHEDTYVNLKLAR